MALTIEAVRAAALKLPSVSEGTSYGTPALRIGKKMIARLLEDGETLVLKIDSFERDILLEAQPEIFFVTDHYRSYPLVLVRLPKASLEHVEMLLRRAWFAAAPKKRNQTLPAGRYLNSRIR